MRSVLHQTDDLAMTTDQPACLIDCVMSLTRHQFQTDRLGLPFSQSLTPTCKLPINLISKQSNGTVDKPLISSVTNHGRKPFF
ncbi:hypothetical protein ElyMa_000386800 [Elysia marginata]|uniref:Uncharacterized protein n=1 Tax=Elysia marginata TaxID=1093978 RepID=A0AAV4FHA5_9GAST|nr:hypothetical protein ElyMa_000386800 [Elysia marginata]